MSISYLGGLSARFKAPHIYFIRVRDLLYIGETQKHPVVRWSEHLDVQGSFRMAAAKHDGEELNSDHLISFHAYQLPHVMVGLPEVQIKQATQAVEHAVHVLLRARPSLLGGGFYIISNTEKTAPRTFKHWPLAQSVAETIVGELAAVWRGGVTSL